MSLTQGLTAWQTSPTPGQCNLSSLHERKVSQWKWWVSMVTVFISPSSFLCPQGPALNVLAFMKSYVRTGEAVPSPHFWQAHTFRSQQLSYLSGSASTCCWWFTMSNADSWAHRLGTNCTAQLRDVRWVMHYFLPVEIINFWETHLLCKRSI